MSVGALAAEAHYELRFQLSEEQLALNEVSTVDLTLTAERLKVGSCLYVPQQDPVLEKSIAQLAIRKPVTQDKASRQAGDLTWGDDQGLEALAPSVYRITKLQGPKKISLRYALALSGWKDRPASIRLITQFYPQLLLRCPLADEDVMGIATIPARFDVQLSLPPAWSVLAPGTAEGSRFSYEGSSFSMVAYRKGQVQKSGSDGARLLTLSHSSYFQQLRGRAEEAISLFESLTGWRPESDMLLVETEDYEPIRIPGLIVLNRPQQTGMRLIQEELSHWSIWQLTQIIADQWFGIGIKVSSIEDTWLTQGFADYLVVQYLESERLLSNLFAGDEGEDAYLRLSYRQGQDLIASYLGISMPHNALVGDDLKSLAADGQRPPYSFMRHAQALRYLQWYLTDPVFGEWIKAMVRKFRWEAMRPRSVLASLEQNVPLRQQRAVSDLSNYWQSEAWPEMSLGAITANGSGSQIEILQQSPLRVVFDVTVKSKRGVRYQYIMAFDEDSSSLYVPIPPQEIASVEINKNRAIFDSDRFNNRSGWPGVSLFPGDARTLADDAYTLIWIPFASKLPGQNLSLQLGWQIMRYVGSGLSGLGRYEPESGTRGFSLNYRLSLPEYAAGIALAVAENDGKVLAGERLWDLTFLRNPLFHRWSLLSASTRMRLRQMVGQPSRNHTTNAIHLSRRAAQSDACGIDMDAEHEISSWVPNGAFSYGRSYGLIKAGCDMPRLQIRSRWFVGATRKRGQVPGGALFQAQNLEEAHIRLDKAGLPLATRLQSFNLDLTTPARLPLPDSALVLPRRSMFKVYSDWGHLQEPEKNVQAAGVGYLLPFGGDVVGRSAVTILQFSLYAVLYRSIDGQIDRKPGFIFDFSGEL